MSVSKIPQCYNDEFTADSDGKISALLVTPLLTSDIKVISDKIRTNSSSESGFVQIIIKPVLPNPPCNDEECECGCKPTNRLIDKIYLPNQTKSDSVQKDMVLYSSKYNRQIYIEAEGLSSGEKVYAEIMFMFFDKNNP